MVAACSEHCYVSQGQTLGCSVCSRALWTSQSYLLPGTAASMALSASCPGSLIPLMLLRVPLRKPWAPQAVCSSASGEPDPRQGFEVAVSSAKNALPPALCVLLASQLKFHLHSGPPCVPIREAPPLGVASHGRAPWLRIIAPCDMSRSLDLLMACASTTSQPLKHSPLHPQHLESAWGVAGVQYILLTELMNQPQVCVECWRFPGQ